MCRTGKVLIFNIVNTSEQILKNWNHLCLVKSGMLQRWTCVCDQIIVHASHTHTLHAHTDVCDRTTGIRWQSEDCTILLIPMLYFTKLHTKRFNDNEAKSTPSLKINVRQTHSGLAQCHCLWSTNQNAEARLDTPIRTLGICMPDYWMWQSIINASTAKSLQIVSSLFA